MTTIQTHPWDAASIELPLCTNYKQGQTAESIIQTYPHLSYARVYVALVYYHENQAQIDAELVEMDLEYERLKQL